MDRSPYCWLLVILPMMCATGCQDAGPAPPRATAAAQRQHRAWLEPVRSMIGVTGRSILPCPSGNCIIMHYPPATIDTGDLASLLAGDPNNPDDDGEVYDDPNDPWCQALAAHLSANTFNCCTYAVGDAVGLTPDDWIAPIANGDTYYTVPMQVILDSYFDRIAVFKRPIHDWSTIELNGRLQPEDVICCVDTTTPVTAFVHAGRICKKGDKNWVLSKFGAGPIIKTNIQTVAGNYTELFNEIWVYRAKPNAPGLKRHQRPGI